MNMKTILNKRFTLLQIELSSNKVMGGKVIAITAVVKLFYTKVNLISSQSTFLLVFPFSNN